MRNKIKLISASTNLKVFNKVKSTIGKSKKIIVHLDSDHSQENVLNELNLYSKLINKGSYLICGDTHVEFFKKNPHGYNKNYSKNNNSMTALKIFLKSKEGKKFIQDQSFHHRYLLRLITCGFVIKN